MLRNKPNANFWNRNAHVRPSEPGLPEYLPPMRAQDLEHLVNHVGILCIGLPGKVGVWAWAEGKDPAWLPVAIWDFEELFRLPVPDLHNGEVSIIHVAHLLTHTRLSTQVGAGELIEGYAVTEPMLEVAVRSASLASLTDYGVLAEKEGATV